MPATIEAEDFDAFWDSTPENSGGQYRSSPVDIERTSDAGGGYNVQIFFNGSVSAGSTINQSGVLASDDVFVLAHSSAVATILAQADLATTSVSFNGDDAVVLRNGTTVVDSIGQVGFDPGTEWGSGLTSTADNTLRRLAAIEAGDADASNAFDPAAQWIGFATDTFGGLGAHAIVQQVPVPNTLTLLLGALALLAGGRRPR